MNTRRVISATLILFFLVAILGAFPQAGYPQGPTIVVLSQAGSLQKIMEEEVIPQFEREFGIKVSLIPGVAQANLARVIAQRNRPETDVAIVNDIALVQGKQQGVWEKFDPAIITNLKNVYDVAKDADGYGVAQGITATVIGYNARIFEQLKWTPPMSWLDLFDPKYKGRVVPHAITNGFGVTFLVALNQILGGTTSDMAPLWKRLPDLNKNVLIWARTASDFDSVFSRGTAWIGENGSTRINVLIDQGLPLKVVYPKEGGIFITAQLGVVRNAPHPREAQMFVNFLLSERIQKRLSETQYYGPVNVRVELSPQVAARVPYGVRQVRSLKLLDWDAIAKNYDQWITSFTRIISQ